MHGWDRYDPDVAMFRVWDRADDRTQFRVNIDAMMNLELMFWAGQNGGNPQYAAMATHHTLRTVKDLVRPDGGRGCSPATTRTPARC